jgi:uncharacterized membrane-anchored protein
MNLLPPDHRDRLLLADEVHARPPESLQTPERATHVAVLVPIERRGEEQAHLAALCAHFGLAAPAAEATHFSAELGPVRLKWERHGEFSGYTLFAAGRSPTPFSEPALSMLPPEWLAGIPGSTVFAAHAKLIPFAGDAPDADFLAAHFDANVPVGAEIGGGAGLAFTDFKIRGDGCARFLVLDRGFTPRQAGRMLQRLFEIETYRMMALLALPVAREQSKRIVAIERSLATLTERIAKGGEGSGGDESLLHDLTGLAAARTTTWSARASPNCASAGCPAFRPSKSSWRAASRRPWPLAPAPRSACTTCRSGWRRRAGCSRQGSTSRAKSRTRCCSSR